MSALKDQGLLFTNALPKSRLGTSHASLESYTEAIIEQSGNTDHDIPKEFSLIVLLTPRPPTNQHDGSSIGILLGKKKRGFGAGFYNSFGGKLERSLDEDKYPARGAVREIQEETGIDIPLGVMEDGYVGTLNFTFEDWEVNRAMKVYLYCVVLTLSTEQRGTEDGSGSALTLNPDGSTQVIIDPGTIRGCDEIEPIWYNNVSDIPLHRMFADDTLWLTMLLNHYEQIFQSQTTTMKQSPEYRRKLMFDGWFHFHPGGTDSNQILHHYIRINEQYDAIICPSIPPNVKPMSNTLEKQLFHALHKNRITSIKEFKEAWAMANAVRKFLRDEERMEYVIDVAGGHGVLAALFLVLGRKCHTATVIDPAVVKSKEGIQRAWSPFWNNPNNGRDSEQKQLKYRHECLRTGLCAELEVIFKNKHTNPTSVLVVACHACQHLTDETMQIASEFGVNVACMPCCQKDHDGSWKSLAKNMKQPVAVTMDLLSAGKMLAWETGSRASVKYQVKMKLIDEKITPLHNRVILCKALDRNDDCDDDKTERAHAKLTKAYNRAHKQQVKERESQGGRNACAHSHSIYDRTVSLLTGFCIGIAFSFIITFKSRKS